MQINNKASFLSVLHVLTKKLERACTRTSKAFKVQSRDIIVRHFVT